MYDIPGNERHLDPPDEPKYPRCPECDEQMYNDDFIHIKGLDPGWACHNPCCPECSISYRDEINDIYLDDDNDEYASDWPGNL